jgi:uncharacterized damage-inducible protein DinB
MAQAQSEILLAAIDRAFDRKSWHGPNLRGVLRLVNAETAAWRPAPGRHNIWELTLHTAYWKYTIRRRLSGGERGGFALKGSNWWERPLPDQADEAAWKRDVALLVEEHQAMRAAVAALDDSELSVVHPGHKLSTLEVLTGIAAHDLYHAGQIQVIKKLYKP